MNHASLANDLLQRLSTNHIVWPLTHRQQQVWACVAYGLTDGEAARDLGVSPSTVRGHVASLERALFDAVDIAGSRPLLIAYFWLHTGCCTRGLLESVKLRSFTNTLFGWEAGRSATLASDSPRRDAPTTAEVDLRWRKSMNLQRSLLAHSPRRLRSTQLARLGG